MIYVRADALKAGYFFLLHLYLSGFSLPLCYWGFPSSVLDTNSVVAFSWILAQHR